MHVLAVPTKTVTYALSARHTQHMTPKPHHVHAMLGGVVQIVLIMLDFVTLNAWTVSGQPLQIVSDVVRIQYSLMEHVFV